jgi:hypothetical protein
MNSYGDNTRNHQDDRSQQPLGFSFNGFGVDDRTRQCPPPYAGNQHDRYQPPNTYSDYSGNEQGGWSSQTSAMPKENRGKFSCYVNLLDSFDTKTFINLAVLAALAKYFTVYLVII